MDKRAKLYTILYIEDEEKVRLNYTLYLEHYFAKVYSVATAEEAKKIISQHDVDILLVDISLPGQNGLEFIKELREYDQNARIIVLTAHSDVEWLLQATQLKLTDYLLKPVERSRLKESLKKAIDEIENYEIIPKDVITLANGLRWDIHEKLFVGQDIYLTLNEQLFVNILAQHLKDIVHSDDICHEIWGEGASIKGTSLKTLVKKLRKKLPEKTIENIYAQGYRLCV